MIFSLIVNLLIKSVQAEFRSKSNEMNMIHSMHAGRYAWPLISVKYTKLIHLPLLPAPSAFVRTIFLS